LEIHRKAVAQNQSQVTVNIRQENKMAKAKLTSSLITVKGHAAPAESVVSAPTPVVMPVAPVVAPIAAQGVKSMTVKLDIARYEALKIAGMKSSKSSQTILVEALDIWLSRNKIT
jgi:hypothetical protein